MAVVWSCQIPQGRCLKISIVTYDGSCLGFMELRLQARDAESNVEKIDCVTGPSKPPNASISFGNGRDRKVSYPVKNCAHWTPVSESITSKSGLRFSSWA